MHVTITVDDKAIVKQGEKAEIDTKQSNRLSIRMGNTVIDLEHGRTGKVYIDAYLYDETKPYNFIVNDDKKLGAYAREG
jgi:hypothetical protein